MNELTPADMIVLIAFAVAATKIFTGPIGAAIGDRIRGRREPPADPRIGVELDRLTARLAETEERLDFAERLLASKEAPYQVPGGAQR